MTEARYRGPEGRRRLARLRRPHEVRRPLAPRAGRLRRRARDGDGPRDPEGVLRRAAGPVLRALRAREHRPAVPRHARASSDGACVADRFLRASDLGDDRRERRVEDGRPRRRRPDAPAVPNGSIGFRWGEEGMGKWNLELGEVEPALTLLGHHDELVEVELPRFDIGDSEGGGSHRRGVPGEADRRPPRHDRLRPARRAARRAPRRAARRLARGLRRPEAVHARLAGGAHGRRRRAA